MPQAQARWPTRSSAGTTIAEASRLRMRGGSISPEILSRSESDAQASDCPAPKRISSQRGTLALRPLRDLPRAASLGDFPASSAAWSAVVAGGATSPSSSGAGVGEGATILAPQVVEVEGEFSFLKGKPSRSVGTRSLLALEAKEERR